MKKINFYLLTLTIGLCVSSCMDKYTEELLLNTPVYMDYATLRSSVQSKQAQDLVHPGKICFKDQYLLIVEYREGVHVIDVSNPANPQNKVFIKIPGCVDIAFKDNFLYADCYVDLVTIDMSDITRPKEKNRLKDVFPYTIPAAENDSIPYAFVDQGKGVVVSWETKREKRELEQNYYPVYAKYYGYNTLASESSYLNTSTGGSSGVASFGKSGSMARFGLYDKYLYIVNNYMLYMIDVENADTPIKAGTQPLGGNNETLFVYDRHLFFGTSTGMLVYDLSVPSYPISVGSYWHITSCDPVVIQNGYAYITLRSGTACNNTTVNRLDIVKCSDDYKQFNILNSYNMTEPYGLGIDGNLLFICDGNAGLKVYDVNDKQQLTLLNTFKNIQTYDVIPADGYLFMSGNNGFYLYDYSNINNIHQIGYIPVVKKN